eukprot:6207970-Amphidinium_carterae.2
MSGSRHWTSTGQSISAVVNRWAIKYAVATLLLEDSDFVEQPTEPGIQPSVHMVPCCGLVPKDQNLKKDLKKSLMMYLHDILLCPCEIVSRVDELGSMPPAHHKLGLGTDAFALVYFHSFATHVTCGTLKSGLGTKHRMSSLSVEAEQCCIEAATVAPEVLLDELLADLEGTKCAQCERWSQLEHSLATGGTTSGNMFK